MKKSNYDTFWCMNVDDIEKKILPKGKQVTDLPVYLNINVPAHGSVLWDKIIRFDGRITPSVIIEKNNR